MSKPVGVKVRERCLADEVGILRRENCRLWLALAILPFVIAVVSAVLGLLLP